MNTIKTPLPKKLTIGEKYNKISEIKTKEEAKEYFNICVEHTMLFEKTKEEAEKIEKYNIGYYSGYFDDNTRQRILKLFECSHPIFGNI